MSVFSKGIKKKVKVDKKQPIKKDKVSKNPDTKNLSGDQAEALQNRRNSTWCYGYEPNDYPRFL
ncbi:MAG: hypothetical protein J6V44_04110 [Methanobrevibacter sp.]|nr:hypothetical protein [Methanobrevibacter sp.]